uniref:Uncharacterized protein ycf72 n=1 Tax=Aegilops tauschii subsp. strangulata TaxID=200361 RepID=A0A453QWQ6_AEGTS
LLTATKNKTIAIFFPFPSSSSKCRITPRGCGFFLPMGAFPSPPPWGWSTGFITTPLTTGRLPSQHLDPALPKIFGSPQHYPLVGLLLSSFGILNGPPEMVILKWPIYPLLQ